MLAKVEDPDQRAYEALLEKIEPLRHRLLHHSVYEHLDSIEAVRVFMEFHCYPVADFMPAEKSSAKAHRIVRAMVPTCQYAGGSLH